MKDLPQRQKILLGILAVVVVLAVYMQFSGGGGGDSTPTSSAPSTSQTQKSGSTSGTGSGGQSGSNGSAGSGSGSQDNMPVDPTQSQRPGGVIVTPPGSFPGTTPPVISYNPYIPPIDSSLGSTTTPTG